MEEDAPEGDVHQDLEEEDRSVEEGLALGQAVHIEVAVVIALPVLQRRELQLKHLRLQDFNNRVRLLQAKEDSQCFRQEDWVLLLQLGLLLEQVLQLLTKLSEVCLVITMGVMAVEEWEHQLMHQVRLQRMLQDSQHNRMLTVYNLNLDTCLKVISTEASNH